MKPGHLSALLLTAIITTTTAFTSIVPTRTVAVVAPIYSKAEDHLEEINQKWKALKAKEESMLKNGGSDGAMDFAMEMVKIAIEHCHAKEEVEEEHVQFVHGALERVLKKEQALESMEHYDVSSLLKPYQRLDAPGEDAEKRRVLTLAELEVQVENYAEERLHQLHDEEEHFREQEDGIQEELKQLKWNEDTLKEVLETLESLKSEKISNMMQ